MTENVVPKLRGGLLRARRSFIAEEIVRFVGKDPRFIAYYADYDWVALCQLYGRMIDLPEGWPKFCLDLKQELDRIGLRLPSGADEHNALNDALWVRDGWLACHREAP